MGFRSLWAGVGSLVLVGGRGFARHGPLRVLGLVVLAENGFDLVFFCFFVFCFLFLIIIWVCGYGFGSGGC